MFFNLFLYILNKVDAAKVFTLSLFFSMFQLECLVYKVCECSVSCNFVNKYCNFVLFLFCQLDGKLISFNLKCILYKLFLQQLQLFFPKWL